MKKIRQEQIPGVDNDELYEELKEVLNEGKRKKRGNFQADLWDEALNERRRQEGDVNQADLFKEELENRNKQNQQ